LHQVGTSSLLLDLVVQKLYFPTKVYLVGFSSRSSIYGWW